MYNAKEVFRKMARTNFKSFVLQKEWLDKCEQAKRTKSTEDNPKEAAENEKRSKEERAIPSRSTSLDSNTLGTFDSSGETKRKLNGGGGGGRIKFFSRSFSQVWTTKIRSITNHHRNGCWKWRRI